MTLRVIVAVSVLFLQAAALAQTAVQVPTRYAKLINATNYVQSLRFQNRPVTPQEAVLATSMACDGLTELMGDKEFFEALNRSSASLGSRDEDLRKLRGDLKAFTEEFLKPEMRLLQGAGLDSSATMMNVKDGFELGSQAYLGKYSDQAKSMFQALGAFTQEVCTASAQGKALASTKAREQLDRLGKGVGGAAISAIDLLAVMTPIGSNPVGMFIAGVSVSWGFPYVQEALK